jgi:hypothetical protein
MGMQPVYENGGNVRAEIALPTIAKHESDTSRQRNPMGKATSRDLRTTLPDPGSK